MAKQLSLPSLSLKVGLEQFSIPFLEIECFGELHIQLEDPPWASYQACRAYRSERNFGDISPEVAIKGFSGVTLYSSSPLRKQAAYTPCTPNRKVEYIKPVLHCMGFFI